MTFHLKSNFGVQVVGPVRLENRSGGRSTRTSGEWVPAHVCMKGYIHYLSVEINESLGTIHVVKGGKTRNTRIYTHWMRSQFTSSSQ